GVDDQAVVAASGHPGPKRLDTLGGGRRGHLRSGRGLGRVTPAAPVVAVAGGRHRDGPSHAGGVQGWAVPAAWSRTRNASAATWSHGPGWPSGQRTRTSASRAGPRPTWTQPSCPPA